MLATFLGIMGAINFAWFIIGVSSTAKASELSQTHTYVILNKHNIVMAYTDGTDYYNAFRNIQHGAYTCLSNNSLGIDCDMDVTKVEQKQLRQID